MAGPTPRTRILAEEERLEPLLRRPAAPLPATALFGQSGSALVEAAARHGLLPALAARLPRDGVAPELRRRLDHLVAGARVRAAFLGAALDEALAALERTGVPAAPLKGPLLALRLHGDAAARPSGDLDLLVAPASLDAAVAALAPSGWRPEGGPLERFHRRHHHHISLERPGGPPLELHHRAYVGFGATLPAPEILARVRLFRTAGGGAALQLAPEDEWLHLALHAAGHLFERLAWIEDLLLLLERQPGLDHAAVAARARAAGFSRPLSFVRRALRRLGAALPDDPPGALGPGRARAAEHLRRLALKARPRPVATAFRLAFQAALADGPAGAARSIGTSTWWWGRRRAHLIRQRIP
jgi:hypothetical protein